MNKDTILQARELERLGEIIKSMDFPNSAYFGFGEEDEVKDGYYAAEGQWEHITENIAYFLMQPMEMSLDLYTSEVKKVVATHLNYAELDTENKAVFQIKLEDLLTKPFLRLNAQFQKQGKLANEAFSARSENLTLTTLYGDLAARFFSEVKQNLIGACLRDKNLNGLFDLKKFGDFVHATFDVTDGGMKLRYLHEYAATLADVKSRSMLMAAVEKFFPQFADPERVELSTGGTKEFVRLLQDGDYFNAYWGAYEDMHGSFAAAGENLKGSNLSDQAGDLFPDRAEFEVARISAIFARDYDPRTDITLPHILKGALDIYTFEHKTNLGPDEEALAQTAYSRFVRQAYNDALINPSGPSIEQVEKYRAGHQRFTRSSSSLGQGF